MKTDRKTLWKKRLGIRIPTEAKPRKERKRPTKKQRVVLVSCVASVLALVATGLCLWFLLPRKDEGYYRYFNNFTSQAATKAEKTLTLSEKTYVDSYEPTERIYVTAREYLFTGGASEIRYGIASQTEEYCPPVYAAIVQVRGDYALVARMSKSGESSSYSYLDLIRFRGDPKAPYSLLGDETVMYVSEMKQWLFVGDYLVAYGTIHEVSSTPTYATFYEYRDRIEPVEVFRVRHAYDSSANDTYTFGHYDDYVVGYSRDRAYFYNVHGSVYSGYLEEREAYAAFGEMGDSLSSYSRSLKIFYLGNGWFVRSAMIYKLYAFEGFNLLIPQSNLSWYARTKTDFYNVATGQSRSDADIFYVENVANRYTQSYFTTEAYLLGSLVNYLQDGERYEYNLPFANPAAMVKDGYSVVYYYYLPHIDEFPYDNEQFLGYSGEVTYCLLDETLKKTQPDNALMPTMYIDDVGITTSDPEFTETRGTAYAYDKDMKETVLATYKQGKEAYIPYYANKEGVIISAAKLDEGEDSASQFFGATDAKGKRIVDFIYQELTFFSGGYAVGYRDGKYYRVDEKGAETEITDVAMLHHGTYIYKDGEKYGLKNYAGDVLIEAVEGSIQVADVTMRDGKAIETFALVRIGNVTAFYTIG